MTTLWEFSMVIYMAKLMCFVLVVYICYMAASVAKQVQRLATANTSTDMLLWACKKYCCCTCNIYEINPIYSWHNLPHSRGLGKVEGFWSTLQHALTKYLNVEIKLKLNTALHRLHTVYFTAHIRLTFLTYNTGNEAFLATRQMDKCNTVWKKLAMDTVYFQ